MSLPFIMYLYMCEWGYQHKRLLIYCCLHGRVFNNGGWSTEAAHSHSPGHKVRSHRRIFFNKQMNKHWGDNTERDWALWVWGSCRDGSTDTRRVIQSIKKSSIDKIRAIKHFKSSHFFEVSCILLHGVQLGHNTMVLELILWHYF